MDSSGINAFLATPAVLLATAALAVVVLAFVGLALRRVAPDSKQLIWPIATLLIAGLAVVFIGERLSVNEQAAERRALEQREAALAAQALTSGSALGCLDSAAGEAVDSACENAVFADPQSVAAAVAYVSARLALLGDGLAFAYKSDPDFAERLAGMQRAIELDRFGIAAHILSTRDGCTAERCPVFALLRDTSALKANLRVGAYRDYVARHAVAWKNGLPPAEKETPVASAAPAATPAPAVAGLPGAPPNAPSPSHPVPSRFDFPSAASIPAVSIMNPEPPLPAAAAAANAAAAPAAPGGEPSPSVPMPPHKPSARPAAAAGPPQQILPQDQ